MCTQTVCGAVRWVQQGFSKWVTGHPGVPWRQSRGDATYFDNIWNLYGRVASHCELVGRLFSEKGFPTITENRKDTSIEP